mgnify:CR=1 FL=1
MKVFIRSIENIHNSDLTKNHQNYFVKMQKVKFTVIYDDGTKKNGQLNLHNDKIIDCFDNVKDRIKSEFDKEI